MTVALLGARRPSLGRKRPDDYRGMVNHPGNQVPINMHITGQRRGFRSRALRLPRLMRQWPISSTGREDSIRSAVRNMLRQRQRRQPRRLPPRQGSHRDNGLHDDGLRGKHHRDLRRRDPHRVDKWEFRLKNTRRHHLELSPHTRCR
jgi:hypothetical protein